MDSPRFDSLAKVLATSASRRAAVQRLGRGGLGAALLAAVGVAPAAAQPGGCTQRGCRCNGGVQNACDAGLVCCADNPGLPGGPGRCMREGRCNQQNCTGEGCACHTGVLGACDDGLVCCADDSSLPGGPGRCETEDICFGNQCQATGNPCPPTCSWDDYCAGCCSGHCGHNGFCELPRCTGAGCECATGTLNPCDDGLVCCPNNTGLLGGPGICAPDGSCA